MIPSPGAIKSLAQEMEAQRLRRHVNEGSSVFINTSSWKRLILPQTSLSTDIKAGPKTCCLDLLMQEFSLQFLFPLIPPIIYQISDWLSLNGFGWGRQPGVITFPSIFHAHSGSFLVHSLSHLSSYFLSLSILSFSLLHPVSTCWWKYSDTGSYSACKELHRPVYHNRFARQSTDLRKSVCTASNATKPAGKQHSSH